MFDNFFEMPIFKTSKARENILSKIRKELVNSATPMPYPESETESTGLFTTDHSLSTPEIFAQAFQQIGGKFVYCDDTHELIENLCLLQDKFGWKSIACNSEPMLKLFEANQIDILHPITQPSGSADACFTDCELLVARTGSVLVSSSLNFGRTSSVYYPVHIVFAYADQLVSDISSAIGVLNKKYNNNLPSMLSLVTGPSRTADIEKTLVVGVHGPCEIFCLYVNNEF